VFIEVCQDVRRFNTCFIVYLIFKGLSVLLNVWTVIGLAYIIYGVKTSGVNESAFV
jgi:hypothetical protein